VTEKDIWEGEKRPPLVLAGYPHFGYMGKKTLCIFSNETQMSQGGHIPPLRPNGLIRVSFREGCDHGVSYAFHPDIRPGNSPHQPGAVLKGKAPALHCHAAG